MISLDQALAENGFDGHLETDLYFNEVHAALAKHLSERNIPSEVQFRDGLGPWRVLTIAAGPWGPVVFAAPADDDNFGCSIWHQRSVTESAETIAWIVSVFAADHSPKFMDPLTGAPITPAPPDFSGGTPTSQVAVSIEVVSLASNTHSGAEAPRPALA